MFSPNLGGEPTVNRFRAAAGAAFTAILIAACSGASSPAADDTPTEEPTATPAPSVEASEDGSGASFAPGAGDLDSILPDQVGGITLEYQFAEGEGVLGSEGITPEVQDFLNRVGANTDDVSSAIGIGIDQASGGIISIFAIRVAGADEGSLRDEFQQVMEEDADSVFTEATLGGKEVMSFGTAGQEPDGYMYVHDDVVFMVGGSTPELTVEALSLLP
jgi:hypothetical protein